ncbi:MAG: MBL fold metallo-hydrolase [Prevotella sp.]
MRVVFLGTGTSNGVPVIGCRCEVCRSADARNRRSRASLMVETDSARVVIDSGPDFREQMLDKEFRAIDALLVTHAHYDHVGGMDDVRPFCRLGDIDVYGDRLCCEGLRQMLPYCFADNLYPGVPKIRLHQIEAHRVLKVGDIEILPFVVMHDRLPILGYRIGALAYITDMKTIADEEMRYLEGVDTLVVNALRYSPAHHSHMTVDEAVAFARRVGARRTFFTHMCHDIGLHEDVCKALPEGMTLAYDGLETEI